jgi:hypothetical protein
MREQVLRLIAILQLWLLQSRHYSNAQLSRVPSIVAPEFGCDCMDYWKCVMSGGQTYSYCGLSDNEVCCFIALNARPVGLLPPPASASNSPIKLNNKSCGTKGADNHRDGEAELAEWPWHVSLNQLQ